MLGQLCELPDRALPPGIVPGRGAAPWLALVDVPVGDVVVVVGVVVGVLLLDVAALAIAAPPPARAPVTASVVSSGLSLWDKYFTSCCGLNRR